MTVKRTLIPFSALALLAGCGPAQTPAAPETPPVVTVADALCRPTPNGRNQTACYLTLTASQDDRLVSISSPLGQAQVHEMKMEGGVMSMAELKDGLPLPAGRGVALEPMGNHVMLTGLSAPLAAGDSIGLTLTFEKAAPLGVRATVGQPQAAR